jgi:hypothetical protein
MVICMCRNKNHKRDGVGLGISKDHKQTIETYADGKLVSKVKRPAVAPAVMHWCLPRAPVSGAVPTGRTGHSMVALPGTSLIVMFGGLCNDDQKVGTLESQETHLIHCRSLSCVLCRVARVLTCMCSTPKVS